MSDLKLSKEQREAVKELLTTMVETTIEMYRDKGETSVTTRAMQVRCEILAERLDLDGFS